MIRVGVIGLNMRSKIAANWHKPAEGSEVAAACDLAQDRIDAFRNGLNPAMFTTTDYRELLARQDIDAVAVISPDYCHEEHAVAALEAGKHVFCEKPLAITVEGCDRILAAWKASGKQLMVGFNMRYMAMYRVMKDIADSGILGDIRAVWVRHFVGRGGEFYFHDWHSRKDRVSSLLLQKGSHDIDIIHWITGRYAAKVSAFGSLDYFGGDLPNDLTCPSCSIKDTCPEAQFDDKNLCAFRREIDVEDNIVTIMELEGGIKASYLQCHFTPDYHRNYTFIGTKGRMENFEKDGLVRVSFRPSKDVQAQADREYRIKSGEGLHFGADPIICRDFLDMIRLGKVPAADPFAGRMSVAAGCAAAESILLGGRPVAVKRP